MIDSGNDWTAVHFDSHRAVVDYTGKQILLDGKQIATFAEADKIRLLCKAGSGSLNVVLNGKVVATVELEPSAEPVP